MCDTTEPLACIYHAALGGRTWQEVVACVADASQAPAGTLCVATKSERRGVAFAPSADQAAALRALDYPWLRRNGELPLGAVVHADELPPPLADLGGATTLVASQRGDLEQIWLTVFGPRKRRRDLHAALTSIAGHLRRALHFECASRCERTELHALLDETDRRRVGWIVLDQDLRARQVSRVARSLAPEDGVCVHANGQFVTSDPRLARRVRAVLSGRVGEDRSALLVARPPARPLMVTTRAVGTDDGLLCAPRVAVVIRLPDVALTCDEPFLRAAYGLTAAEARFARLLVEGLTVREAADRGCVTMNTARTHLKRVFAKTQTRRQAELVALLTASVGVGQ